MVLFTQKGVLLDQDSVWFPQRAAAYDPSLREPHPYRPERIGLAARDSHR